MKDFKDLSTPAKVLVIIVAFILGIIGAKLTQ